MIKQFCDYLRNPWNICDSFLPGSNALHCSPLPPSAPRCTPLLPDALPLLPDALPLVPNASHCFPMPSLCFLMTPTFSQCPPAAFHGLLGFTLA